MKEIKLTQGKIALVDDEDYEKLNKVKWCAHKNCKTYYAERRKMYKVIQMHCTIMGKPPEGLETNHKDGNGLNNQKYNLRFVTNRQNAQNKVNRIKTSQYPGVCWHKNRGKWGAQIVIDGTTKNLGRFASELETFIVYRQAVNELGEKIIGG